MSTSVSTEPEPPTDLDPLAEHDAVMRPIVNHTPFQTRLGVFVNPDRSRSVSAVLMATFSIPAEDGAVCRLAADQLVPQPLPSYIGERGRSSIRRPADVVPYKPGTDVVVLGHAHAPHGRPVAELTASVKVGDLHKSIAVVGDRHWRRAAAGFGLAMTEPEPFERMPLRYERAFGGCPPSQREQPRPDRDERNPVGTGYCVTERDAQGMRLPNLEAPEARIAAWRSVPPVAGFGAIDAHWASRRRFAGTFDAEWRRNQRPYLPRDLDPRFYSVASPGLFSPVTLFGELPVELLHLSPTPVLRFVLPDVRVHMSFQLGGQEQQRHAELWTIVLEPDERRVSMVWGARCRDNQRRTPQDRIEIRTDSLTTEQVISHAS